MPNHSIPNHAATVLVPVANPDTAPDLLRLGASLMNPEEGRLIALFVSLGEDTAADVRLVERITPLLGELGAGEQIVELKVHVSTSVSRGILDMAREEHADLLVLGIRQSGPRRDRFGRAVDSIMSLLPGRDKNASNEPVRLGDVVESVVAVTPCDVLVYQPPVHIDAHEPFKRVVVPVDGSVHSAVACQLGILIGESYEIPVQAVYVQPSYQPEWRGRGRIEQSLTGLAGQAGVIRMVVTGTNAATGVLSRAQENDLTIVGLSEQDRLQRWLVDDFTGRLLRNSPGAVILLRRSTMSVRRKGLLNRMFSHLTLTLTDAEQDEILWQAEEMASPTLDYLVLIFISSVLASLGLLLNSTAVVIGAMLVAPLMQPLMGISVGGATGRIRISFRALGTLIQGVFIALITSGVLGILATEHQATTEMLARGNPGLLDLGVALASGFVGAFAMARKDIPGVLAGVAIAAALVPPLCTAGISLGAGNLALSSGAGVLFLMNVVAISMSGFFVFLWLGMRPKRQ